VRGIGVADIINWCGLPPLRRVRVAALAPQLEPLHDAEAVLLVNDGETETGEIDALLNQRMRSDDQLRGRRGL